jgi:MFS superfamily sulfate permease-like transporter
MMAVVAGVVCIAAGVLRLGFVTELLSKPIRYGYMNGIALTVLISQLPKMFGIGIEHQGPGRDLWHLATAVADGQSHWHWPSLAIGAGCLALILGAKRFPRVPGLLIAVVLATLVVGVLDLAEAGVKVLGDLPQGLPHLVLPWLSDVDLIAVVVGGGAVALVAFADTSVLSRTYAARTRSAVDPNQEMVGLGAANLAAGLFQGFPISSSSSRTPVRRPSSPAWWARWRWPCCCWWRRGCCTRCPPVPWRRWSSPRPSACSRLPTCGASYASNLGSSGSQWPASPAWPSSAPFPASAWQCCWR